MAALHAMSRHLAASPYTNRMVPPPPPPPPDIPMEVEIEVLRREREILLHRIGELEQGDQAAAAAAAAKEETPPPPAAGIIHSVNIRTNNSAINHSSPIKELVSSSRRSSRSQSDLDAVQIEVKGSGHQRQKAVSQDHLGPQRPSPIKQASSVSVVNLSSPTRSSSPYDGSGLQRSRTNSFGAPQYPPRNSKAALLLPGRMSSKKSSSGLNRLHLPEDGSSGQKGLKSRSVEHLPHGAPTTLGLKAANSEVALIQKVGHPPKPRLKGTHSELNVSRIGVTEKLRVVGLNPILGAPSASAHSIDGAGANASMPVDLAQTSGNAVVGGLLSKAASVPIKPNREKIRAVLAMSNVIELQRHLLTTVMENEVLITSFSHFEIPQIYSSRTLTNICHAYTPSLS